MRTPLIAALLCAPVVLGPVYACTKQQEAKDAYWIQSHACLQAYDDAPHQKDCLEYVRNRWTEAGAPLAATDGGSHE